jgi:NAD dependent epimerase/dehydratase family enzyme
VSLDDEVRAILHIIDTGVAGAVNICGPTRATANDLGRSLAREMHRPYWLPAPAWALRLVLGRNATESLLTSDAHVLPELLENAGFQFNHRTVDAAVRAAVAAR